MRLSFPDYIMRRRVTDTQRGILTRYFQKLARKSELPAFESLAELEQFVELTGSDSNIMKAARGLWHAYKLCNPRRLHDADMVRKLAAQGQSSAQIAEALGTTPGTIRVLCSRSRIKIKRGPRGPLHSYRPPSPPRTDPQTEARERLAELLK